ncbi:MAG: hypothetical protein H6693_06310 [Candidatus Latescibacteria bacterium]|nr:hypothetical protein [Candidatus Latescibacterota bacterium]
MRLLTVRLLAASSLILLAGGAFARPGVPQTILNIEAAEAAGQISHDEAALNKIYDVIAPEKVDARFIDRAGQPGKCATAMLAGILADEAVSESVKDVLRDYALNPPATGDRALYISPSGIFRLTYFTTGTDAVPTTDTNPANGIPDFVERCAEYMDWSWQYEIDTIGFEAPTILAGVDYQVSFKNFAYYGVTYPLGSGRTRIELHRNFIGFPANDDPDGDQLGAAKVTAGHEFKHASQYPTSNWSEGGWVELDATWMEDQVYPATNDYHNYIAYTGSPLYTPQQSLDSGGSGSYEDCIWQTIMSEKWGMQFIVDLWQLRASFPSWPMLTSYDNHLATVGSSRAALMAEWTRWNYLTGFKASDAWDDNPDGEGGYPDAHELYSCNVFYTVSGLGTPPSTTCEDMGARYARHLSVSGLSDYPKITFNGDDTADFRPQVIIKKLDGTLQFDSVVMGANDDGEVTLTVPFSQISELGISFPHCSISGGYKSFSYTLTEDVSTDVTPEGTPAMRLHPAYPNPFNPKTNIRFDLAADAHVTLAVVSPMGRVHRTLLAGELQGAGEHTVVFDGKDDAGQPLASGVYFAMLSIGGRQSELTKLTLLK